MTTPASQIAFGAFHSQNSSVAGIMKSCPRDRRDAMHEVSIMEEAVRLAVAAAKSADANRVVGLRLRIGALSGVVPEAMRFAFDVVCRGTMAEGASLEIESVPAAAWCETCRREFECAEVFDECPRCHNFSGELRHGRELEIALVEMN